MATIPHIQKKPEPPKPPPVPTYTIEQMTVFGWLHQGPLIAGGAIPRMPDPRIQFPDPRIQKKETP
jgi:hypothetical protein